MEHFLMMVAPELVIVCAVLFMFVYAGRYNNPAD